MEGPPVVHLVSETVWSRQWDRKESVGYVGTVHDLLAKRCIAMLSSVNKEQPAQKMSTIGLRL